MLSCAARAHSCAILVPEQRPRCRRALAGGWPGARLLRRCRRPGRLPEATTQDGALGSAGCRRSTRVEQRRAAARSPCRERPPCSSWSHALPPRYRRLRGSGRPYATGVPATTRTALRRWRSSWRGAGSCWRAHARRRRRPTRGGIRRRIDRIDASASASPPMTPARRAVAVVATYAPRWLASSSHPRSPGAHPHEPRPACVNACC